MLEQYEQALEEWIGAIVEQGDDDQLFASGYLQGHFAVVLSQLEVENWAWTCWFSIGLGGLAWT